MFVCESREGVTIWQYEIEGKRNGSQLHLMAIPIGVSPTLIQEKECINHYGRSKGRKSYVEKAASHDTITRLYMKGIENTSR